MSAVPFTSAPKRHDTNRGIRICRARLQSGRAPRDRPPALRRVRRRARPRRPGRGRRRVGLGRFLPLGSRPLRGRRSRGGPVDRADHGREHDVANPARPADHPASKTPTVEGGTRGGDARPSESRSARARRRAGYRLLARLQRLPHRTVRRRGTRRAARRRDRDHHPALDRRARDLPRSSIVGR